ncbi:hypothetical protein ASG22_14675 [Chryseobacterium sp. Leaf405]|uniref:hypothetical protein n=1 Tax=Chryseobacterium sp. Leaf405 TaxID=1736367 RepID=UPI0006FC0237|nr:hypothetical protein [Chryseobacterium sp. Leaf405]KQT22503.1 hypothetical protein ASG22_14675 [Chryseobacterium sp. Leaf405]
MTKINITAKIEKNGESFLFYINIFNISEETLKFNLSNNTGGLARETIHLYDKNKNRLNKGVSYMTPINNVTSLTSIETGESTQVILKANLEEIENDLFLEFKGANFNVKKDKTYYFQIEYLDTKSDMIPFNID